MVFTKFFTTLDDDVIYSQSGGANTASYTLNDDLIDSDGQWWSEQAVPSGRWLSDCFCDHLFRLLFRDDDDWQDNLISGRIHPVKELNALTCCVHVWRLKTSEVSETFVGRRHHLEMTASYNTTSTQTQRRNNSPPTRAIEQIRDKRILIKTLINNAMALSWLFV